MTESDVNAILVRLEGMEARTNAKLDSLVADNIRAEHLHNDHEQRIRSLERVRYYIGGLAFLAGGGGSAALLKLLGG